MLDVCLVEISSVVVSEVDRTGVEIGVVDWYGVILLVVDALFDSEEDSIGVEKVVVDVVVVSVEVE